LKNDGDNKESQKNLPLNHMGGGAKHSICGTVAPFVSKPKCAGHKCTQCQVCILVYKKNNISKQNQKYSNEWRQDCPEIIT